jgi:hypothetical protein
MAETTIAVDPQAAGAAAQQEPAAAEPAPAEPAPADGNGHDDEGLLALGKDQLVEIIRETRGEAKTRRMKQRELEAQVKTIQDQIELNKQKELESKQEWEKAYNELKEKTKDYPDLKDFREAYLKECSAEIEKLIPNLTKPEQELFELSKDKMSVNEQIVFIKKLVDNRPAAPVTDNTQSTGRGGQPAPKVMVPFGNTTSVVGKVMESLRAKRK